MPTFVKKKFKNLKYTFVNYDNDNNYNIENSKKQYLETTSNRYTSRHLKNITAYLVKLQKKNFIANLGQDRGLSSSKACFITW